MIIKYQTDVYKNRQSDICELPVFVLNNNLLLYAAILIQS